MNARNANRATEYICGDTGAAGAGRVLIVDDHAQARSSMRDILRQAGHQVDGCSSALEALQILQVESYDVVITDLNMPGMSGDMTVAELRANGRTRAIPILIHTGMVVEERERRHLAVHVQSIIFKCERAALLSELEKIEPLSDEQFEPATR